jgi:flagellar hook assembly protein FlgD
MLERVKVRYARPAETRIRLAVYNVAGQRVCTLREGVVTAAGKHEVEWDGRHQDGKEAGSGIYFVSLESKDMQTQEEKRFVQKVVKVQ